MHILCIHILCIHFHCVLQCLKLLNKHNRGPQVVFANKYQSEQSTNNNKYNEKLTYAKNYTTNKVAYNSTTEASDYEIGKGLRDQLLFSIQFIKKPTKWNYAKGTNTSVLVECKYIRVQLMNMYNWGFRTLQYQKSFLA